MKVNWKRTVIVAADLVLAVYLAFGFTKFNKPDDTGQICTQVKIDIRDEKSNGFLTTADIKNRLEDSRMYPLSKPMSDVNGRAIEDMLRKSPFVKTAECYKTTDGHVFITLTQRMPIVRIKSANNDDYYLDDHFQVMPNTKYTSDLIVATGHISRWYAQRYISLLADALMANDLWKNQIEQINVLPDRGIELVPRVGNHIVYLGQLPESRNREERAKAVADFVSRKMTRLEKFYKYGLSQAGWNKYSYISLEFDNQIICKKCPATRQEPAQPQPAHPETETEGNV